MAILSEEYLTFMDLIYDSSRSLAVPAYLRHYLGTNLLCPEKI